MFCKQCSQQLNATDRKCPACGVDVEAMSDCGGFYRLRHGRPGPETAAGDAVVDEEWRRQNEAARRAQMTHHKVMICGFAAMLVLTVLIAVFGICVLLRLGQLERQLREPVPIVPTGPAITGTVQTEPKQMGPSETESPETEPPETEPSETEPPEMEPPEKKPNKGEASEPTGNTTPTKK